MGGDGGAAARSSLDCHTANGRPRFRENRSARPSPTHPSTASAPSPQSAQSTSRNRTMHTQRPWRTAPAYIRVAARPTGVTARPVVRPGGQRPAAASTASVSASAPSRHPPTFAASSANADRPQSRHTFAATMPITPAATSSNAAPSASSFRAGRAEQPRGRGGGSMCRVQVGSGGSAPVPAIICANSADTVIRCGGVVSHRHASSTRTAIGTEAPVSSSSSLTASPLPQVGGSRPRQFRGRNPVDIELSLRPRRVGRSEPRQRFRTATHYG